MTRRTDYVTKTHFDEVLRKLLAKVAMREDLEVVKTNLARVEANVGAIYTNLDTYLKKTEVWHDEMAVLRMSHQRLKETLVRKGVVSDAELAV